MTLKLMKVKPSTVRYNRSSVTDMRVVEYTCTVSCTDKQTRNMLGYHEICTTVDVDVILVEGTC